MGKIKPTSCEEAQWDVMGHPGAGGRGAAGPRKALLLVGKFPNPFLFRKKEMACKEKPFLVGKFPNPFLFGRAQKETVSGCQRKRPF